MTYPTSKKNALASLYQFVEDNVVSNVLDVNTYFVVGNYEQAMSFPSITALDIGAPDLPPMAFNDFMGGAPGNAQRYGRESQTVVEFNCLDKTTTVTGAANPNAQKNVYLLREKLRRALYWAGQTDTNGDLIFPAIDLLDFDVNGHPWTGGYVYWPSQELNTWFETPYLASQEDPQLKRIQIAVRFRWTELLQEEV
jgi:hypothetical protein